MTNKLEIHGLDLTGMGIGDVVSVPQYQQLGIPISEMNELMRAILGSITFGPVMMVDLPDPEDEDDGEWGLAE